MAIGKKYGVKGSIILSMFLVILRCLDAARSVDLSGILKEAWVYCRGIDDKSLLLLVSAIVVIALVAIVIAVLVTLCSIVKTVCLYLSEKNGYGSHKKCDQEDCKDKVKKKGKKRKRKK